MLLCMAFKIEKVSESVYIVLHIKVSIVYVTAN